MVKSLLHIVTIHTKTFSSPHTIIVEGGRRHSCLVRSLRFACSFARQSLRFACSSARQSLRFACSSAEQSLRLRLFVRSAVAPGSLVRPLGSRSGSLVRPLVNRSGSLVRPLGSRSGSLVRLLGSRSGSLVLPVGSRCCWCRLANHLFCFGLNI